MLARHALRRPKVRLAATAALLLLCAAPVVAKKPLKEIKIDCADGDSINHALERQETELILYISGICTEDVVVRRDNVKLLGTDPALDGIQAATVDATYGAALFIRSSRYVEVENLQLTGAKHAGLIIEDSRRAVNLRNLQIEGNLEVGFRAANSLVVGYDLSITGNGIAGIGLSETAYLRCTDCVVYDNPSDTFGFGIVGSAGALATMIGGSVSGRWPISFRFNAVADLNQTDVSGEVAIDAQGSASVTVKGATVDGSIRVDSDSQVELANSRQALNPLPGGNVVTGGSQLTATGTTLIGETAFDEFSNGVFRGTTSLETLACSSGGDAVCDAGVTVTSSSCSSC